MNTNAFGIDLGTSNIRIYNRADDEIMMEKNMIAIENKKHVFAYGDSAFEMYEKAPGNINISYPLANGVIADINNMEVIIRFFITALMNNSVKPADYYIAVPTDVTEVEKRAFYDLIKESNVKAKKIMVVEKAIADGLGMDIDIKNSQGVLVVDIGFDTTEISILSLGGIVLSRLIKIGGLKFDEAIKNAVRKEFSLFIGGKTAENVKINLAELEAAGKNAVVYGRDIVTGLPVEREISTDIVNRALEEHFYSIIDNIKVILERTPPELSADIYRHGIYLTGGGSMVNKLAEKIANGTGLKVNIAENPQKSVALGLAKIIKDDNFKTVAYSIEGMGK
ncbi:MAG: rod shape-determining protein [Lachnospiraceae bacterium]|nr:rod shape-determining protein [Lachnospiraceae bacterium]